MMNNIKSIPDTSLELNVHRHRDGLKMIRPDRCYNKLAYTGYSIKELLHLPLNVIFLNCNSVIEKINENNTETCGFDSSYSAIGKTIYDTYHRNSAEFSIQHDMSVLKGNCLLIKEEKCERIDNISFNCLTAKLPWYNDEDQLVGVIGLSIALGLTKNYVISDALSSLAQLGIIYKSHNKKTIPNTVNDIHLSKRESDCLEYLVNGMSARQTAEKLNISRRTVEGHISNIKYKFGMNSKFDLIEYLMRTSRNDN